LCFRRRVITAVSGDRRQEAMPRMLGISGRPRSRNGKTPDPDGLILFFGVRSSFRFQSMCRIPQ
jgi:hypothetical protein